MHQSNHMSTDSSMFPSVLDWSLLLAELEQPDFDLLRQYLRKLQINVLELADENGFTLVHHAVLKGIDGKVKQVISLADALQKPSKADITRWINGRTHKDQFTPLHLASYRGNMDAVRALIAAGADVHAENFFGLNMVHVAAQGDQATTLYFFKSIGIDINKQDKRGSTPLHWACYSQSEIALTYLLAWSPDLNKQD